MYIAKKSYFSRLSLGIGGFILLVLAVGISAKLWLIPAAIKSKVRSQIKKAWGDSVSVGSVKFSYNGRVQLEQITLQDSEKRKHIQVGPIDAALEKWPLEFKVTTIDVDSLKIQVFSDNSEFLRGNRLSWNIIKEFQGRYFDINKLTIKDIWLNFYGRRETEVHYDNLSFSLNRDKESYQFLLKQTLQEKSEYFSLVGIISPATHDYQLELDTRRKYTFDESCMLTSIFNLSSLYKAEGVVAAKVDAKGDFHNIKNSNVDGYIELEDTDVLRKEAMILKDLICKINLNGRVFNADNIQSNFCGGKLQGGLTIDISQPDVFLYNGWFSLEDIRLAELKDKLDTSRKFTKGTGTLQFYFRGSDSSIKTLQGDGTIFMDNADLQVLPMIPHIFTLIGLKEYDPTRVTDLAVVFNNNGPVVTLDRGQLANRLSAIRAEPGGKIDLKNQQIEMHVVAVPLKQIDDIAKNIPLASILLNLKDKMVRLKVQGKWSDPPGKLITKEPLVDIKEGTLSFLGDVRKSGGQITETMLKPLKEIINHKKNK